MVVHDAMVEDPDTSRKALLSAAKGRVNNSDNVARLDQVKSLERQGEMLRATTPDTATTLAKAIQSLPHEQMKFALNTAVDTLPHNSNLHMWKKESDSCPLCGERQSLIHVLNCCRVARDLRGYNVRHDTVLKVIADTVKEHLPPSHKLTVDLDHYQFPIHISPTDLRPDIVLLSDSEKQQFILAELTVSFETSFEAAAERKVTNYQDLVFRAEQAGYSTTLITLEMGS